MVRKLNLGLIGLLALVGFAIAILLAFNPASAGYTGDGWTGIVGDDWDINQPTHVWDEQVYIFDADVNVNSQLTLHNTDVYLIDMWGTNDAWDFNVAASGSVIANDSSINPWNGPWGFYWDFYMDGTVDFERCNLNYMMNMSLDGTAKFYNRTYVQNIQYADLGGSVTFEDSSYLRYVHQELDMSGTVNFKDNSNVHYIYGVFNITGRAFFDNCDVYRTYNEFNVMGTLDMNGSSLRYIYGALNVTGTLDITYGYGYRMYSGMWLHGVTSIDLSDFYYMYQGVHVNVDKVTVTNTKFYYMYDAGFYFDDCEASLNNVTIDVNSGTQRGYWKTDKQGDYYDRFTMTMGIGIWVVGGSPSFVDVDVEADAYGEFNLEYSGSEQEVRLYARAVLGAVMIDSTEMDTVSGLTVHNSYMSMRTYMMATNPSINPLYFDGELEVMAVGIGIVNYKNVTVTDVMSYGNTRGSTSGPYMSGGYYGGNGYWNSRPSFQIGTGILGDFSSAPTPILRLMDMEVDDGSYWFGHMYNPGYTGTGAPQFENTVLVDNVTINSAWSYVFQFQMSTTFEGKRSMVTDVQFTNCYFTDLYTMLLTYYLWPGEGLDPATSMVDIDETFGFRNCTITQSRYSSGYLGIETWGMEMPSDRWDKTVTLADNEFIDTVGRLFYAYAQWDFVRGSDTMVVVNNNFENCTDDTYNSSPWWIDAFDTIRFVGNTFKDMNYAYSADFYDYGGSNAGAKPVDWLFKDNTWDNCTNRQYHEVIFLEFSGDVLFTGNEVMNQEGLMSIYPVFDYTGSATLDIIDNEFHHNSAYFVEYGNPQKDFVNFVMTISDNEVYMNEDFFLNYWGSSSTLNNFDYDAQFIISDNNFTDNTGGIIHAWGDISVKDNTFTNNMGPLLLIDYINLNVPDVSGNAMVNNEDLFRFEGKDRGYQLATMELADQTLSCSGTALYLVNMEVTLDNVDIVGAETAILVMNSVVNAFSSSIDGDACHVMGDGLITSWWPVEVYVTWGDKDGMDSGTPVSEALIVFNTAAGDYYSSDYAGTDGMLAQSLYREWTVDLGGVNPFSPYTMKVAAAGATNDTQVVLDRDLINDDMVHLVLWDIFPPVVAITEPFNGAIFAKDTLDTYGFVAEVGSGLESVEYSTDGGDNWMTLPTSGTGDWTVTLSGLMDGDAVLMVRAMDIAGNIAQSTVTITIDTTPPALSIVGLPAITNDPNVGITGTVEVGSEVFLNGMSKGIATSSALMIDHTLHEGVNVIVIEAVDMAGNIAMETLNVVLDTYEPVLVVTGPATGIVTNADSVMVTGIVEVGSTLTVGGTQVVPDEAGSFSYEYSLSAGDNSIEIKATDAATNANTVTLAVHQDQDPPNLEIQEPDDGTITGDTMISVHIVTDEDAKLWLNGRTLAVTGDVTVSILLVEGDNAVTVKAMDPAGNVATETITVRRDTEPPSLMVTTPEMRELWTNAAELDIEGVAMRATVVSVNGVNADYDSDTGVFTISVPISVGQNNITVIATDGVNDVSSTIKAWVSRTAPALNVDAMEPTVRTSSVTITGNTDVGIDHVTVEYSGISQDFTTEFDGTFAVTLNLADGSYDVKVSATDRYGNTAESSTGSFTVKAKKLDGGGSEEEAPTVEPIHIGLILAVIGIALIIAAYASAHFITRRRREELEESD